MYFVYVTTIENNRQVLVNVDATLVAISRISRTRPANMKLDYLLVFDRHRIEIVAATKQLDI